MSQPKIQPAPAPLKTDVQHSCLADSDLCNDISKRGHHIRRVEVGELKSLLERATKESAQQGFVSRKDTVRCLLVSFESNDLPGLDDQMHKLAETLQDQYGYEVEEWKIPTLQSSIQSESSLRTKLVQFVDAWNGKKETLLVLYSGHGGRGGSPSASGLFISGARTSESFSWNDLQDPCLLYTPKDVLLILDCCCAARAFADRPFTGRKDVLTASGLGSAAHGDMGYTVLLTEMLASMKFPNALTPEVIHQRLLSKSKPGGGGLKFLPNHCGYPADDGHQIELAPKCKEWVKVGLAFRGPLDMKEFRKWLDKEITTLVGPVSVESKSFSTAGTIVVTMPAFLWDRIRAIESRIDVVVKKLERTKKGPGI